MTAKFIVVGVVSAILCRIFIPADLSVEVYQWVYSTIVQAFAAMVAVVGMFAIYKLQLLRHNVETEAERLGDSVRGFNMAYGGGKTGPVPEKGLTVSDDFIGNEKAFQILGQEIDRSAATAFVDRKKIEERGNKASGKDKLAHVDLGRILEALSLLGGRHKRIETAKKSVATITRTIKTPLVISGVLIGISLFLLSLSDINIIDKASCVFLWLLAGVIGTAFISSVCLSKRFLCS